MSVCAVQGKAAVRHAEWRRIAAEFVADWRGTATDDFVAIATGHAVLAATLAAHEYWVTHPTDDLLTIMERILRMLIPGGGAVVRAIRGSARPGRDENPTELRNRALRSPSALK